MPEERIQKILARSGVGSRRNCELIISEGRVSVNGRIVQLGDRADVQNDTIAIDGKIIKDLDKKVYIALYKPRGYLSIENKNDPRPNIYELIDFSTRVFPVGRLDIDSEGLLLLTNDGDLTYRLSHPKFQHEKEYRVKVKRRPDKDQLEKWRRGVVLDDGYKTRPAGVNIISSSPGSAWLQIILTEGKKHQIRRTGLTIGLSVERIIRVRIGSLKLGKLRPKEFRMLVSKEVSDLKRGLNLQTNRST